MDERCDLNLRGSRLLAFAKLGAIPLAAVQERADIPE
jgi:hypothetical protein